MEQAWECEWVPSECAKHPRWNARSSKPVLFNAQRLQKNTRALLDLPYEPGLWLLRAQLLLGLGYPELAAGDAYKARLLVEAGMRYDTHLGMKVRLHYGMSLCLRWHHRFDPALGGLVSEVVSAGNVAEELSSGLRGYEQQAWSILIIALQHLDCIEENHRLAQTAATKFGPGDEYDAGPWSQDYIRFLSHLLKAKQEACKVHVELAEDAFLAKKVMLNGSVLIRRYPWMKMDTHLKERDADALDDLLAVTSNGQCRVRKSNVVGADLGVFATKAIPRDGEVLVDHTYMAATSEAGRCLTCCEKLPAGSQSDLFCSQKHRERAQEIFAVVANNDTIDTHELHNSGLVRHNARNPLTELLLLRRFLAVTVHALTNSDKEWEHPLAVPEVNRLAANDKGTTPLPWNFLQAIVLPNRMLEGLGIDIFADQRFDTWVIHTICYRINNNQAVGYLDGFHGQDAPCVQGVYPCHSLFNHSCEPNVSYDDHPTKAAQIMKAKRDIAEGEELYIAYDLGLDADGMDVRQRREALRNWMGEDCQCTRCLRENGELTDKK